MQVESKQKGTECTDFGKARPFTLSDSSSADLSASEAESLMKKELTTTDDGLDSAKLRDVEYERDVAKKRAEVIDEILFEIESELRVQSGLTQNRVVSLAAACVKTHDSILKYAVWLDVLGYEGGYYFYCNNFRISHDFSDDSLIKYSLAEGDPIKQLFVITLYVASLLTDKAESEAVMRKILTDHCRSVRKFVQLPKGSFTVVV